MSETVASAAQAVVASGSPGASVAVRRAQEVDIFTAGFAVLPTTTVPGVPVSADLRFDCASVTKVVATTAVLMRMVSQGTLDLDAPVGEILPDVTEIVTIADLLSHRSGLPAWLPLYCRTTERETALDLVERTPMAYPPRTGKTYSDLGFMLLGRIVERVHGAGLAATFDELVARPLGLASIGYGPLEPARCAVGSDGDAIEHQMVSSGEPYQVSERAENFAGWRHKVVRGTAADGNVAHALGGVSGHAGIFATAPDLLAVLTGLFHRPGFVEASVRTRFATVPDPAHPGHALGFQVRELTIAGTPARWLGHNGFTGPAVFIDPKNSGGLALAANRLHGLSGGRSTLTPVDTLFAAALSAVPSSTKVTWR